MSSLNCQGTLFRYIIVGMLWLIALLGGAAILVWRMAVSLQELEKIKDIGPIAAKSIYRWFREKRNLKLLQKLKKAGVEIIQEKKPRHQPLKGNIFVFTGKLKSMSREQAKRKIQELGGEVSESVSKKTDFLVLGADPGSKYQKAKTLGVKIIKEKEFLKIITTTR